MSKDSNEAENILHHADGLKVLKKGTVGYLIALGAVKDALAYAAKQQAERDARINEILREWESDKINSQWTVTTICDIIAGKS